MIGCEYNVYWKGEGMERGRKEIAERRLYGGREEGKEERMEGRRKRGEGSDGGGKVVWRERKRER